MRKITRFGVLAAWFSVLEVMHGLLGPHYAISVVEGVITAGVLYVPQVQERIRASPIISGIVVLIASALTVLFVEDNVIRSMSLTSVIVHLVTFVAVYLLFQGRLEQEQ